MNPAPSPGAGVAPGARPEAGAARRDASVDRRATTNEHGVAVGGPAGAGAVSRHTTGSIAASLPAELIGPSDIGIRGVESVDAADPGELTFIRSTRFAHKWATSRASAALVTRGVEVHGHDPSKRALLIVDNADLAMISILRLFAPRSAGLKPGVHPTAIVDPSARIGQGVHIGPWCSVGPGAVIGDGCVLFSSVTIGEEVSVGAITRLHPGVRVLDRCTIGAACELWPNVVIGADGFGYVPSPDRRGLLKVPHIGTVEIGDGVDIGACTCVDRGKFGATVIGAGTKIDNHVQIGHNTRIGRGCAARSKRLIDRMWSDSFRSAA